MREHFIRWSCNVCGEQTETPSDAQPVGWVGYGFTETGIPAGEQVVLGHLCEVCHSRLEDALEARRG